MNLFSKKRIAGLCIVGAIAIAGLWQIAFAYPSHAEIHFFDVGQGDAIFIETPSGVQVLIDGGPDATVLQKLGEAMPFWDRTLDLVVLTHPDADHLIGLIDVLAVYDVHTVVTSGIEKDTPMFREWASALKREKARIILIDQPKRLQFGTELVLDMVWPQQNLSGKNTEKPNDYAIVMKVTVGDDRVLLTADIERWAEQKMLATPIDLTADILKVAHHGSKTSSSEAFLSAVAPKIAVISSGANNRYGHPYQGTLERLARMGIDTLRTDIEGDIVFLFERKKIMRK